MDASKESQYYKSYIAGYRDGVADAYRGNVKFHSTKDLAELPVTVLGLSTRARNCLLRAKCQTVADILALDEHTVHTMRNLGPKTAAEIAQWLVEHYYFSSIWVQYL